MHIFLTHLKKMSYFQFETIKTDANPECAKCIASQCSWGGVNNRRYCEHIGLCEGVKEGYGEQCLIECLRHCDGNNYHACELACYHTCSGFKEGYLQFPGRTWMQTPQGGISDPMCKGLYDSCVQYNCEQPPSKGCEHYCQQYVCDKGWQDCSFCPASH